MVAIIDKLRNKLQDLKGKGKVEIGAIVGNKDMEQEGTVDQTKAGLKDAVEHVKDAVKGS